MKWLDRHNLDGTNPEMARQFLEIAKRHDEERSRDDYLERCRKEAFTDAWHKAIGRRYAGCTFDSFEASTKAHEKAVEACRQYASGLLAGNTNSNLVLIGGVGGGKDHLGVAVLRVLFDSGDWMPKSESSYVSIYPEARPVDERDGERRKSPSRFWEAVSGASMLAEVRQAMHHGNEAATIRRYTDPHLLVLSDPTPITGDSLSSFQSGAMMSVIDQRYRDMKPIICTLNCKDRKTMDAMIGEPLADRLCHDAVIVPCDWPSYRKAKR